MIILKSVDRRSKCLWMVNLQFAASVKSHINEAPHITYQSRCCYNRSYQRCMKPAHRPQAPQPFPSRIRVP